MELVKEIVDSIRARLPPDTEVHVSMYPGTSEVPEPTVVITISGKGDLDNLVNVARLVVAQRATLDAWILVEKGGNDEQDFTEVSQEVGGSG